jgi:hypothetical protein
LTPSKKAAGQAAIFEKSRGTTGAEVIATELFDQFLFAVYDP